MTSLLTSAGSSATVTPPAVLGWPLVACTADPTTVLLPVTAYGYNQTERSAAHYGLGNPLPIVLADVVSGTAGTVTVQTFDYQSDVVFGPLRELLRSQATLWLASPFGFGRYIRAGLTPDMISTGGSTQPNPLVKGRIEPDTGAMRVRTTTIAYVEQARP